jgi:hypothetical protein
MRVTVPYQDVVQKEMFNILKEVPNSKMKDAYKRMMQAGPPIDRLIQRMDFYDLCPDCTAKVLGYLVTMGLNQQPVTRGMPGTILSDDLGDVPEE